MTSCELPLSGNPKIDEGHRDDETRGFGTEMVSKLSQLGYRDLVHVHGGMDARIYSAIAPDGRKVAIRIGAPFSRERWRNKVTWKNYVRMKLLTVVLPRHFNIIQYLRSGSLKLVGTGGDQVSVFFLVMPFEEGKNLLQVLTDPAFKAGGLARVYSTILGMLRGWVALHQRWLRHGDLTAPNFIIRKNTWEVVMVDLRFSTRFLRTKDRTRNELRRTLRALLTGTYLPRWQREKELSPLSYDDVLAFWPTENEKVAAYFRQWADFAEGLEDDDKLGKLTPPQLLAHAEKIAREQA